MMSSVTLKIAFVTLLLSALLPFGAYAQTTASHSTLLAADTGPRFHFVPIVPIPISGQSGTLDENTSLGCYVNAVFNIAIMVSVVLAVIMIIIDGFKYMTTEAVGNKKDALGGIRQALFGLILLLASWLILHVINPQITNLNVLQLNGNGSSCASSFSGSVNNNTGGGNGPQPGVDQNVPGPDLNSGLPNVYQGNSSTNYCFTTAQGQQCFPSNDQNDPYGCPAFLKLEQGQATSGCTQQNTGSNTAPSNANVHSSNEPVSI